MCDHEKAPEYVGQQFGYPENINNPYVVKLLGLPSENGLEISIALAQENGYARVRVDVPESLHKDFLAIRDRLIKKMGLPMPLFFHQKELGVYWHHILLNKPNSSEDDELVGG